jgi:hypothetical protein
MPDILDEFEELLQKTLESRIFNWLPDQTSTQEIIKEILVAIKAAYGEEKDALIHADFMIHVSPDDYSTWFSNQIDLTQFSRLLTAAMTAAGIQTAKPLAFHIMADSRLNRGKVSIQPAQSSLETGEPHHLGFAEKRNLQEREPEVEDEMRAFFTCANGDIFHLEKPVINVGRREANDIVLADQRVSRLHAQVRRVKNQHILFDLNSTGGTLLNDRPIIQATLSTGDVVSFGGVLMIYAEEIYTSPKEDTNDLNGTTHTPSDNKDPEQGLEIL